MDTEKFSPEHLPRRKMTGNLEKSLDDGTLSDINRVIYAIYLVKSVINRQNYVVRRAPSAIYRANSVSNLANLVIVPQKSGINHVKSGIDVAQSAIDAAFCETVSLKPTG